PLARTPPPFGTGVGGGRFCRGGRGGTSHLSASFGGARAPPVRTTVGLAGPHFLADPGYFHEENRDAQRCEEPAGRRIPLAHLAATPGRAAADHRSCSYCWIARSWTGRTKNCPSAGQAES